jgi:hypothetical protein
MGFHLDISDEDGGSAVSLAVILTRQETNDLFLSGDSMISWPEEGLRPDGDPLFSRTSMFVSEVAARPQGMILHYQTREQAERSAQLLRLQLDRAGIAREG